MTADLDTFKNLYRRMLRIRMIEQHLDEVTSRRRENAKFYFEKLRSCPHITAILLTES